MLDTLSGLENAPVDLELMGARLADVCRDQETEPPDIDQFLRDARELEVESQRRLALIIQGLNEKPAGAAFIRQAAADSSARASSLFAFAREHALLTVSVLIDSPLRREEFARHLITHLGETVQGEDPEVSRERLRRLDYRTLLADAERAKASAEERVAYLRRLQEEQEQKLGRRSKF